MSAGGSRRPAPLLERGEELGVIGEHLDAAAAGAGRIVLIEGSAGIGKTRLLWETRRLGAARGFRPLGARCDELEDSIAFGLASQLLTASLQRADRGTRVTLLDGAAAQAAPLLLGGDETATAPLPPLGDPSQALLSGLTWLVGNLSAQAPLLLLIDDAHWADSESLRWLNHLAKQLGELRVLVALTVRRGEMPAAEEALAPLATAPVTFHIAPERLSEEAARSLLEDRLAEHPSRELAASAYAVTGGNPLLLDALALELLAQGAGTGPRAAKLAERLVPESLIRTVLLRLRRLPGHARAIAEALTILGEGRAETVLALAAVAEDGEAGIEALEAAELVESDDAQLRFAHPIIRSTIYEQISPRRKHRRHVEAARLLRQAGEAPERIAPHLIAAGDVEVPGGAEILIEAGKRVYALGAPEASVRYFLRALELNPDPAIRAEILLQLGVAATHALDGRAVEYLKLAVDEAAGDAQRRSALMWLARAQITVLDMESAASTFGLALAESHGDRELELSAEAELASAQLNLHQFDDAVERISARRSGLVGATAAERKLLAVAAFASVQRNEPAAEVLALCEAALGDGLLIAEQSCTSIIVVEVLLAAIMADGYELAGAALEGAISDARERGWPIGFAVASAMRSWLNLRRGDLRSAESDALAAESVRELHGATPLDPFSVAHLATILGEQGRGEDGERLIAERCPDPVPDATVFQLALHARGELRIARGNRDEGVADLLTVGEREVRYGGLTPAGMAWRSNAAAALAGGDPSRARALAEEELELAESFGSARSIGIARRGVALAGTGDDAIPELERSVAVLRASEAKLELSRSLVELGSALRRRRRAKEARDPLREAAGLAAACGATALEQRALEELGATGEHQRSADSDGLASLTPSELRAARMAASGRSNREIADGLFVTPRTIEVHLTRAYRKLGIRGRRQLAEVLGESP